MAGRNVSFSKPKTPSFIAKFKEKVGYQESATVETKFQETETCNLDNREHEDEKPTVVLGSNVSEAEANAFLDRLKEDEADSQDAEKKDNVEEGGKILFKKPTKRKSSGLNSKGDRKKSKPSSSMKNVKNKSLLSFNEEEDGDL
ncbi:unnamed protein product [Porites lobata]|uniref:DUF4604 domain-containing protein n=1 Tax=Porites lobata TaxID=104759 RepID=A0ABN8NY38_9CNID|nr:unnamed protein product [Porites lobata]